MFTINNDVERSASNLDEVKIMMVQIYEKLNKKPLFLDMLELTTDKLTIREQGTQVALYQVTVNNVAIGKKMTAENSNEFNSLLSAMLIR